jgi:ribosomal small subunit protein bTHX
MGKGDKKSKKGKRFQHSFGKTRLRKKGRTISSRKKVVEKPKHVEHKKPVRAEPEAVKPALVFEPRVEEVKIKKPVVTEIKEEVKLPEVKEESISGIPEIAQEPVKVEPKIKEPEKELPKPKSKSEEPASETPKKRGRPKKIK